MKNDLYYEKMKNAICMRHYNNVSIGIYDGVWKNRQEYRDYGYKILNNIHHIVKNMPKEYRKFIVTFILDWEYNKMQRFINKLFNF